MVEIFREIGKTIMFVLVWVIPVYLAETNGNTKFLLLFVVSFLMTFGIFGHYEDLKHKDDSK